MINIPIDKQGHLLGGMAMGAAFAPLGLTASVALVAAIGIGKEVRDWLSNRSNIAAGLAPVHGVEAADVYFTVGGGVAGNAVHGIVAYVALNVLPGVISYVLNLVQ